MLMTNMIGREKESDMPFFNRYSRNPKNQHLQIENKIPKTLLFNHIFFESFPNLVQDNQGNLCKAKTKKN